MYPRWIIGAVCVLALGCEVSSEPTEAAGPDEYQLRDARMVNLAADTGPVTNVPAVDAGLEDALDGSPLDSGREDGSVDGPADGSELQPERPREDSGRPVRSQGGDCGACDDGFVCLASIERCVPDCRLDSNECPARAPSCDQSTGTCIPSERGDGPGMADDERGDGPCGECDEVSVCAPGLGRCVPDCRVEGQLCPDQRPDCDEGTGLCLPGPPVEDGGVPPEDAEGGCGDGCGRAAVCDPVTAMCVRDCRSIIGRCSPAAPNCDPQTGLCFGD